MVHLLGDTIAIALLSMFSVIQNHVTPLYVASQQGHDHVVQLLLDSGACVDKPNEVHISYYKCRQLATHHLNV